MFVRLFVFTDRSSYMEFIWNVSHNVVSTLWLMRSIFILMFFALIKRRCECVSEKHEVSEREIEKEWERDGSHHSVWHQTNQKLNISFRLLKYYNQTQILGNDISALERWREISDKKKVRWIEKSKLLVVEERSFCLKESWQNIVQWLIKQKRRRSFGWLGYYTNKVSRKV